MQVGSSIHLLPVTWRRNTRWGEVIAFVALLVGAKDYVTCALSWAISLAISALGSVKPIINMANILGMSRVRNKYTTNCLSLFLSFLGAESGRAGAVMLWEG
jgi:hypothetical protein